LRQYYSFIYSKTFPKVDERLVAKKKFTNVSLIELPNSLNNLNEDKLQKYNKGTVNLFGRKIFLHTKYNPTEVLVVDKKSRKWALEIQIQDKLYNLMFHVLMRLKQHDITDDNSVMLFVDNLNNESSLQHLQHFEEEGVDEYINSNEIKKEKLMEILNKTFRISKKDTIILLGHFEKIFKSLADNIIEYLYQVKYVDNQQLNDVGLHVLFEETKKKNMFGFHSLFIKYIKFKFVLPHSEVLEDFIQNFVMDHENLEKDEEETYGFEDA
jgi:hypothetical protein